MNTAVPDHPDPARPVAARTGRRPDRPTARRVLVGVACGMSCLVGVTAVAVLCWTVATAAALPARLVVGAPWLVTRSMSALTGVMVVVFLNIPVRRAWCAVARSIAPAADPAQARPPDLRELGGKWAWWSRLSLSVVATTAFVELTQRGWHALVALAVAVIAVLALDVAALAVHPARLVHHAARMRGPATGSPPAARHHLPHGAAVAGPARSAPS